MEIVHPKIRQSKKLVCPSVKKSVRHKKGFILLNRRGTSYWVRKTSCLVRGIFICYYFILYTEFWQLIISRSFCLFITWSSLPSVSDCSMLTLLCFQRIYFMLCPAFAFHWFLTLALIELLMYWYTDILISLRSPKST